MSSVCLWFLLNGALITVRSWKNPTTAAVRHCLLSARTQKIKDDHFSPSPSPPPLHRSLSEIHLMSNRRRSVSPWRRWGCKGTIYTWSPWNWMRQSIKHLWVTATKNLHVSSCYAPVPSFFFFIILLFFKPKLDKFFFLTCFLFRLCSCRE